MTDSHTRFTIITIAVISILSLACGTYLIKLGYQTGEQAILIASAGLSGLVGFLGGRSGGKGAPAVSVEPPSNVTVTTAAPLSPPSPEARGG